MEKMKLFLSAKWPWVREHLISAAVTFVTGFCLALLPQLQNLDSTKLEVASIWGLVLACLRAGFKMLVEQFIIPGVKKLNSYLAARKKNTV